MDTTDLGQVFAFTASKATFGGRVDIFSREADLLLAPELTSEQGYAFLRSCMARRFAPGFVQVVQTDGAPEFKGAFAQAVSDDGARHRVARPYKKNEQASIESFNRTVRARNECLGWLKYQSDAVAGLDRQAEAFLARYHVHRPHLGLDPLRPPLPVPEKRGQGNPTQDREDCAERVAFSENSDRLPCSGELRHADRGQGGQGGQGWLD